MVIVASKAMHSNIHGKFTASDSRHWRHELSTKRMLMEFTLLEAKTASQASGMQQSGHWRRLMMRGSVSRSGSGDIRNELLNWGYNEYCDQIIEHSEADIARMCNSKASRRSPDFGDQQQQAASSAKHNQLLRSYSTITTHKDFVKNLVNSYRAIQQTIRNLNSVLRFSSKRWLS